MTTGTAARGSRRRRAEGLLGHPHRPLGAAAPVIARWARVALSGLVAVAGLAACGASGPRDETGFDHLALAVGLQTQHASPATAGAPISVVRLGQDSYLACDYTNVYRVALTGAGYAVTILAPPPVPVWTPAGLDYRNGSLYVANFNSEDVLQVRLVGDRLDLVRRITVPGMLQPKRVHVEPDGSMLVADHNSDAVLRLRPDGTLEWRVPVDQVNGLAESGGYVPARCSRGRSRRSTSRAISSPGRDRQAPRSAAISCRSTSPIWATGSR